MKHFSSKIALTLAIALAGFSAGAQEFKVGVVNLDRIFREANSAKAAQTKLEQEFSKREKELNDISAQLKTLAEAEKYDLILQESVYVNPKHDITDKVIKALNAAR